MNHISINHIPMKNKFVLSISLLALLTIGFGCSFSAGSGDSDSKKAAPSTSPGASSSPASPNDAAKTGVAECDEFIDLLDKDLTSPDDNFVTRGIRQMAIDYAKGEIKKNVEENKGDKEKIAAGCKKAKEEYLKDKEKKAAEENKK